MRINEGILDTWKVTLVFSATTFTIFGELKSKGVELNAPFTAVWAGREINLKDPDRNIVILPEQE